MFFYLRYKFGKGGKKHTSGKLGNVTVVCNSHLLHSSDISTKFVVKMLVNASRYWREVKFLYLC